jgi:hypothetical protein
MLQRHAQPPVTVDQTGDQEGCVIGFTECPGSTVVGTDDRNLEGQGMPLWGMLAV